jgi:hypothetical protein
MNADFLDTYISGAVECTRCGALVLVVSIDRHAEWHKTLDKALDPAPLPFQCAICFCPIDGDQNVCGTCADLANEGAL